MPKYRRKESILSIILLSAVLILLGFFFFNHYSGINDKSYDASKSGTIDYSQIDFEQDKLNTVKGKVNFYWNELLDPLNFKDSIKMSQTQPSVVTFPGYWNESSSNTPKGFGYATYQFDLKFPDNDIYAFKIKELNCAYKLWINGELKAERGIVAKTKDQMEPSWDRTMVHFIPKNKNADIVLQISNFHHRRGGPGETIILGKLEHIDFYKDNLVGLEIFILGVLFILTIYHLTIYYFKNDNKAYIYFAALCILLGARLITTGEEILLDIFPRTTWYIAIKIEYISFILLMPKLLLYAHYFYKTEIPHILVKILAYVGLVFSIFVLVAPAYIFTYIPVIYQIIIGFITIYLFFVLIQAVINKRKNALVFLVSYSMFYLIVLNDILYFNHLIPTIYLLPFGIFILAFVQSVVLSQSVALAFIRMQDMSLQMDEYNKELEKTVEKRTLQVFKQKTELEQQAKQLIETNSKLRELNSFKESLTQMIVHDLKTPLNVVLNFTTDDRVKFAGMQMLNLVQNLLDVQRYEHSKMNIKLQELSLNQMIHSAIYQLSFLIKEKNILLKFEQHKDYSIFADEEIMNRVFVNLLSNALKFTPTSKKVTIKLQEEASNVQVLVSDSGPGIPEDQRDLIFEKFGQFIVKKAGNLGSTGLGLTFCKMAIEAHEGTIDFDSELGKGTTFICSIPLNKMRIIRSENNISIDYSEPIEITLSTAEKEVLRAIAKQLEKYELYEVGKLKSILANVSNAENTSISVWVDELKNAIWSSNEGKFKKLLKMTE